MRLVVRSTDMVRSVTAVRMLETAHPVTSVRARATPGTASRRPLRAAAAVYLRVAAMQLDAWNVSPAGQVSRSYRLRGGRGEFDRLAPPAPGMGDGDAAVMDDTRLDLRNAGMSGMQEVGSGVMVRDDGD